MKNKLIFNDHLQDVRMIFGSGVSTFLDRARKFLYLVPDAKLSTIKIHFHQFGLLQFKADSASWDEFKLARLQKDSMVLSHNDFGHLYCYRFKILLAISIRGIARMIVIFEEMSPSHLENEWDVYINRYHQIDDFTNVRNTYFVIDHFTK